MKKILLLLCGGMLLLLPSCGLFKAIFKGNDVKPQIDTTAKDNSPREKLPDPKRNKDDVPGRKSLIWFRPDSQIVVRKKDTLFLIYDQNNRCLFFTTDHALYEKIRGWLPEEIKDSRSQNCVLLIGTIVDPITLISGQDLITETMIAKVLQFNNMKVYGVTGHAHYPNGPPQEILDEVNNQKPIYRNKPGNQNTPPPNLPNKNSGRDTTSVEPKYDGTIHQ